MQAAATRGRGEIAVGDSAAVAGVSRRSLRRSSHGVLETVRQGYLDALPIAAAIITLERRRALSSSAPTSISASSPNGTSGSASAASPRCRCCAPGRSAPGSPPSSGGDDPALPVRHRRRPQHRRPPFHRPLRPPQAAAGPAAPLPDLADRQDRAGRDREEPALGDAARQPDRPAQPLRLQREGRGGARRSRLPRGQLRRARRRHDPLQPGQRMHGRDGRRRIADHLRPPPGLGAAPERHAGAHLAATSSAS